MSTLRTGLRLPTSLQSRISQSKTSLCGKWDVVVLHRPQVHPQAHLRDPCLRSRRFLLLDLVRPAWMVWISSTPIAVSVLRSTLLTHRKAVRPLQSQHLLCGLHMAWKGDWSLLRAVLSSPQEIIDRLLEEGKGDCGTCVWHLFTLNMID